MEEAKILEWAGVSFGEEESYKLSKSIKVFCFSDLIDVIETCLTQWSFNSQVLGEDIRYQEGLLGNRRSA